MREVQGVMRLGVLISGRGSNLQALIDAFSVPGAPAEIVLVVSNRADAAGLARADAAGIPSSVVDHKAHADKAGFEAALTDALRAAGVDLVCLAGFMRVLSPSFVQAWTGRLVNIHPSLLPDYKGLDTHARVIADGRAESGCTVHFVTAELDGGPIIAQERVPVLPGDTPDTLAARVLAVEHRLYPSAVAAIARGDVRPPPGLADIVPPDTGA